MAGMKQGAQIALIIAIVLVGGGLLVGGVELTSSNWFCSLCHSAPNGNNQYLDWEKSTHANPDLTFNPQQSEVGCADCHIPGDPGGFITAKFNGARDAVYWLTRDFGPARRRFQPNLVPDTTCLACHKATLETSELTAHQLSDPGEERMALLGIRYDHQVHISVANAVCAECHNSKENYFARNYLTCGRCHAYVAHNDTSSAQVAIYDNYAPRAEQCDTCHTGKLHVYGSERLAKMAELSELSDAAWSPAVFLNDCPRGSEREIWWNNTILPAASNCAKCHPTIEGFVNLRQGNMATVISTNTPAVAPEG